MIPASSPSPIFPHQSFNPLSSCLIDGIPTTPHCDVLLVEPDPDIRQVVQTSLEITTPWQVSTTYSYAQGAELIVLLKPRVVILNLPLCNSPEYSLVSHFQGLLAGQGIFLMVMLERVRDSEYQRLMNLGIHGIVPKPFDCQQVITLLQAWLD